MLQYCEIDEIDEIDNLVQETNMKSTKTTKSDVKCVRYYINRYINLQAKVITLSGKRSLLHYQATIITLSGRKFITLSGDVITLSGDFITLSGSYYINRLKDYYIIGCNRPVLSESIQRASPTHTGSML